MFYLLTTQYVSVSALACIDVNQNLVCRMGSVDKEEIRSKESDDAEAKVGNLKSSFKVPH